MNPDRNTAAKILALLHDVADERRLDTLAYAIAAYCEIAERTCARCGDAVQYLASDDLCDGCAATHTSTPLWGAR